MKELQELIHTAFAEVQYPGDANLRNSSEGQEPFLLEKEFVGKDDWRSLSPEFIDQAPDGFSPALSFFSKAAFHFYLPAYLLAELTGQLLHTDPVFYLTYGLTGATRDVQVNPRRYGTLTWYQYVADRFSLFTPEQADAIASYLNFKLHQADTDLERDRITQALHNYWESRPDPSTP